LPTQVTRLMTIAIAKFDQFPSLAQLDALILEHRMVTNWVHTQGPKGSCQWCDGSGWCFVEHFIKKTLSVVICEGCEWGRRYKEGSPFHKVTATIESAADHGYSYKGPGINNSNPEKQKVEEYTRAQEGLFLGYEKHGYPSPFGLQYCGMTEENFLDVYHEWKNGRVHPIVKDLKEKKNMAEEAAKNMKKFDEDETTV
jgi:hypothetical protein